MQIERQWHVLRLVPDRANRRSTEAIWSSVRGEKHFADVSKRTVERDLALLQTMFPIEQVTEGRTNYWYWASGVSMWLPGLTDDEALAFHMVERNMQQLLPEGSLERLAPYFKVARAKLDAQSVRPRSGKFRLIASGVPRVARKIFNPHPSRVIREALLSDQQVLVSYWIGNDSMDTVPAIINPLALVQRDKELLLVFSRQGSRDPSFIPMRNIDSAQFALTPFDGPVDFDVDRYIASGALHFEDQLPLPVGSSIKLCVSFTKEAWNRLCNSPIASSKRVSTDQHGRRRISMSICFTADLVEWLLSLGPKVEVHQPVELRRWISENHSLAANQY